MEKSHKSLTSLDLSGGYFSYSDRHFSICNHHYGNYWYDWNIQYLSNVIKINTTLTSLNLSGQRKCAMRSSDYSVRISTDISDEGVWHLCDALKVNQKLTLLDLSHNDISDTGLGHICELLQTNTTLNSINLADNKKITTKGFANLLKVLKLNTTLTTLKLPKNIDQEVVQEINQYLARNRQIAFQRGVSHIPGHELVDNAYALKDIEKDKNEHIDLNNESLAKDSRMGKMPKPVVVKICSELPSEQQKTLLLIAKRKQKEAEEQRKEQNKKEGSNEPSINAPSKPKEITFSTAKKFGKAPTLFLDREKIREQVLLEKPKMECYKDLPDGIYLLKTGTDHLMFVPSTDESGKPKPHCYLAVEKKGNKALEYREIYHNGGIDYFLQCDYNKNTDTNTPKRVNVGEQTHLDIKTLNINTNYGLQPLTPQDRVKRDEFSEEIEDKFTLGSKKNVRDDKRNPVLFSPINKEITVEQQRKNGIGY